jgi:hypothetical protein
MKNVTVLKEEVDYLISQSFWTKTGVSLKENLEAEVPSQEVPKPQEPTLEVHSCPLCESALSVPITDEKLSEHINSIMNVINELNTVSDEDLIEASETESD